MPLSDDDVFLVFLDRGDDALTHYAIAQALGVDPSDPERAVTKILHAMVQANILVEFDVESDGLDGVLVEHNEFGSLDNDELSFSNIDNIYCLGPKAFGFLDERKSHLAELASDRGLGSALERLMKLRADSSSWTGLPTGFSFTPEVQAKVIKLLTDAIDEVERSSLGNSTKVQAGGYLQAALILARAPDPQPDLIAILLKRLRLTLEAVGLFANVLGLLTIFKIIK